MYRLQSNFKNFNPNIKYFNLKSFRVRNISFYLRTWVIVSHEGGYVTQRQEPKMALIKVSLHGNTLSVDAPGMPTLQLPTKPQSDKSQVHNVK